MAARPITSPERTRIWKIVVVGGFTIAALFVAFLATAIIDTWMSNRPTVYERPGLRFVAQSCKHDPEHNPLALNMPNKQVTAIAWGNDGVLRVDATVVEGCSRRPKQGDYSIGKNTISLSYATVIPEGAEMACSCEFHIAYQISGIPRANYRVIFPEKSAEHATDYSRSGQNAPRTRSERERDRDAEVAAKSEVDGRARADGLR